jgi:hypothetical protein
MPIKENSGTSRILRRIRAALADLDGSVVSEADRLDALYEIQDQITRRILAMERPTEAEKQAGTKWSPVRY